MAEHIKLTRFGAETATAETPAVSTKEVFSLAHRSAVACPHTWSPEMLARCFAHPHLSFPHSRFRSQSCHHQQQQQHYSIALEAPVYGGV